VKVSEEKIQKLGRDSPLSRKGFSIINHKFYENYKKIILKKIDHFYIKARVSLA
jgi:hypothetical protein